MPVDISKLAVPPVLEREKPVLPPIFAYGCMYVCLFVCMYVCICACMCAYVHVCVIMCMYFCMYVCFVLSTHKQGNHMHMLMSYMLMSMAKDTFAYRDII